MAAAVQLRPYQEEALRASLLKFSAGTTRQVIASPCATGKTVLFANLARYHHIHGRVLVLVHRRELAAQAAEMFRRCNSDLTIGCEVGSIHASSDDDVVVASVQALGHRNSIRLSQFDSNQFGVIICDECHHSVSRTYRRIFDYFGVGTPGSRVLLVGVSATPERADGVGLNDVYDELVYDKPIRDAVLEGWLCDVHALRIQTTINLDPVHTRYGDFVTSSLVKVVNAPIRNRLIVDSWCRYANGRPTVVFCADIQHAKDVAECFRACGIAAAAVWGSDPERDSKLAAHRAGSIRVLSNCAVLTEGYNDWRISCVVVARPTKSQPLFVQMVGRGLRLQEGISNLREAEEQGLPTEKRDCLVIDVADCTKRHTLATVASIFGLPANADLVQHSVRETLCAQRPENNSEAALAPSIPFKGIEVDLLQPQAVLVQSLSVLATMLSGIADTLNRGAKEFARISNPHA
jgi:superfamily II DNA or RNA helicase